MKPMYKPKPQLFPGWLCATIVALALLALALLAMAVVTMSGCKAIQDAAETYDQAYHPPTTQPESGAVTGTRVGIAIANQFPWGELATFVIGNIAGAIVGHRRGKKIGFNQVWTPFVRVVNAVDQHIPDDEAARAKLQAAQGDVATRLVKAAKAERP